MPRPKKQLAKTYQIEPNRTIILKNLNAAEVKELDAWHGLYDKLRNANRSLAKENADLRKQVKVQRVKRNLREFFKKIKTMLVSAVLFGTISVITGGVWFLTQPDRYYERLVSTVFMILVLIGISTVLSFTYLRVKGIKK